MSGLEQTVDRLARNRGVCLALVVVYVVVSIVLHRPVGDVVLALRDAVGVPLFATGVTVLGVAVVVLVLLLLQRRLRDRDPVVMPLVLGVLLLQVAVYVTLVGYHSEVVHFPQYALLAVPIYALNRRFGSTIVWVTLAGAADELVQYASGMSLYLDFNDIVLNAVGGAFGLALVVLAGVSRDDGPRPTWPELLRAPAAIAAASVVGLTVAAWVGGLVDFYLVGGIADAPIVLSRRDRPPEWWLHPANGKSFHILRPLPALALLTAVAWFHAAMDRRRS